MKIQLHNETSSIGSSEGKSDLQRLPTRATVLKATLSGTVELQMEGILFEMSLSIFFRISCILDFY